MSSTPASTEGEGHDIGYLSCAGYTSLVGEVTEDWMRAFLAISRALSDEGRVRAFLALRGGELCLCQIIELLGLSPSTVSKHMEVLYQAGLVRRRKEGRWHYFELSGREASPAVRGALRWVLEAAGEEAVVKGDAKKLCCLKRKGREEVSACYRGS